MAQILDYPKIRAKGNELFLASSNGSTRNIIGSLNSNDIKSWGAVGDGLSHPLSDTYTTLQAAQVDYPYAESLSDEKDWSAFNSAIRTAIASTIIGNSLSTTGCSIYVPKGTYLFNKPLLIPIANIRMTGDYNCASVIRYTGTSGTADAIKYILDCRLKTDLNQNIETFTAGLISLACDISYVKFDAVAETNFVSALSIFTAVNSSIYKCLFGANLYDGLVFKGASMLSHVEKCWFYGQSRDSLSVMRYKFDFTTSITVRDNEFGLYGRYAIIMDMNGGSYQTPVIENNDFEGVTNTGYINDKTSYVHNVRSSICLINGNGAKLLNNRFEDTTSYDADVHFVRSFIISSIGNFYSNNVAFSAAMSNSSLSDFLNVNGWSDITNTRNYETNVDGANGGASFINDYGTSVVAIGDGLNRATDPTIVIGQGVIYNATIVEGLPDFANKVISYGNIHMSINGIKIGNKAVLTEP